MKTRARERRMFGEAPRFFASALLLAALLAGCGLRASGGGIGKSGDGFTYSPPPGTPAFRALRLQDTKSIITLQVTGDDVRSNMASIVEVLLKKGYAVRDYNQTLSVFVKERIVGLKYSDPKTLKKIASLFPDDEVGIGGDVRLIQLEPLKIRLELRWIDLKKGKVLWSAKGMATGVVFGGADRYSHEVHKMISQALSVIPNASR
ncbi:MAG: hypothetical protein O2807_00195 [bacterium]|nr:hypothetical protein [bacterium]